MTTTINYERIKQGFIPKQGQGIQSSLYTSVKDFGAQGDGAKDDTAAIKSAISSLEGKGGTVVFPKGIYLISETLFIPPYTKIVGEGKENTIIKASQNENFTVLVATMRTGLQNSERYVTMITTTHSGDNGDDTRAEHIGIENLTIDWNHRPSRLLSVAPIMMDRTKYAVIEDVEVINALPKGDSDYIKNQGCSLLFSHSSDAWCNRVILHEAMYESLSVRHLSKNIRFYNGVFDIENDAPAPQEHAFQNARPSVAAETLQSRYGEVMSGPLYVENCQFYLGANVKQAGCTHQGKETYLNDNYFFVRPTALQLEFLYKPFTIFRDCTMNDNFVDMTQYSRTDYLAPVFFFEEENSGWGFGVQVKGNTVKYRMPDGLVIDKENYPLSYPLFGGQRGDHKNVDFSGNEIKIDNYPAIPFDVVGIRGYDSTYTNNKIEFLTPATSIPSDIEINAFAVYGEFRHGIVKDNIATGSPIRPFSHAIKVMEDSARHRFIMKDNVSNGATKQAYPKPEDLTNASAGAVLIKDNVSF